MKTLSVLWKFSHSNQNFDTTSTKNITYVHISGYTTFFNPNQHCKWMHHKTPLLTNSCLSKNYRNRKIVHLFMHYQPFQTLSTVKIGLSLYFTFVLHEKHLHRVILWIIEPLKLVTKQNLEYASFGCKQKWHFKNVWYCYLSTSSASTVNIQRNRKNSIHR